MVFGRVFALKACLMASVRVEPGACYCRWQVEVECRIDHNAYEAEVVALACESRQEGQL